MKNKNSLSFIVVIGVLGIVFCALICILVVYSLNSTSTSRLILEKENLSYEELEKYTISLTNEEYECHGTCYCENYSERRSSVPLVSRSISYLFVSVSSIAAFQQAKVYFENSCEDRLSSECHLSSIKSSVNECSKRKDIVEESIDDEYLEKQNAEERRVYFCYGNCVENLHLRLEESKKQFQNRFICGDLRQEGEIVIYRSDIIIKSEQSNLSTKFRQTACHKFQQYHLVEFCKESSRMEYLYSYIEKEKKRRFNSFGCVGSHHTAKGMGGTKINVRCRLIDPKPKDGAAKWRSKKWWNEKKDWDEGTIVL